MRVARNMRSALMLGRFMHGKPMRPSTHLYSNHCCNMQAYVFLVVRDKSFFFNNYRTIQSTLDTAGIGIHAGSQSLNSVDARIISGALSIVRWPV